MASFKGFTNLQPVTKTVKFRLEPVGNTMKNVKDNNILKNAEIRVEKRNELKVYIDRFHKDYIDKKLGDSSILCETVFTENTMNELMTAFSAGENEEVEELFIKLGKALSDYMTDSEEYKFMEKKEFINDILPKTFADDEKAQEVFAFFKGSATEVRSLNEKRKELYTNENKHGTIIHRTIWDNLLTYLSNCMKMEKFLKAYTEELIMTKNYKSALDKLMNHVYGTDFSGSDFMASAYALHVSQLGIDKYNTLIGGYTLEDGTKMQGLNEIIHIHNAKSTDNSQKLPLLNVLYKQMMSDSRSFSFIDDIISSDHELYDMIDKTIESVEDEMLSIENLLSSIAIYDTEHIYLSKYCHGKISNFIFGQYAVIDDAITADYNDTHPAKDKETKKYIDTRKKELNKIPCYSIAAINGFIKEDVCTYFSEEISDLVNEFEVCLDNYKKFDRTRKPFRQNKMAKILVKALLDSMININRCLKNLVPAGLPIEKDEDFYEKLTYYIDILSNANKTYNRSRNYATKKEFEKKELGITFNNKDFLSGWTNSNVGCGALLLKDNNYYLAVIDPNSKSCLNPTKVVPGEDNYQMVDYNLLTDPAKSLPHMFMSKKFLDEHPELSGKYEPLYVAYDKHKNSSYQYTEEDEQLLIEYYAECLKMTYDDIFNYSFQDPQDYRDVREFFGDVAAQSYKLKFIDVSTNYINSLINEGKIYLFKISSRDFSDNPKNTTTLFGLYWKMLFDPRNIEHPVYKLNGGASVTYREKSIDNPFVHKAGDAIALKKSKNGATRTFKHDIVKNKRYTYDSFFFSVSLTINYSASSYVKFNSWANDYIRKNSEKMHVIGITRGIKNLIYYTVTDMQGNVVEHNSLNIIKTTRRDNTVVEDNYNELLENRARENAGKKEQWDSEYTIKDLKQGYMSQVVSVIAKLMIKYNAIVVLEDVTGNMKDKMKAIEKTVYTDFENALLNKLNFLITDKDIANSDEGSVLKAYQLCARVDNKEKMRFQNGFVFFLSPAYTSNMDPSTGFVNMLDTRYRGKENARVFLDKLDFFDRVEECYRFAFDYKNFRYVESKVKSKNINTYWVLNTNGIRYNIFRNKNTNNRWKGETVNLTFAFDELFAEYNIDTNADIIKQMMDIDKSALYDKFFELFRLTLMTNNNLDDDYIYASPVEGSAYNDDYGIADNIASYNMARKGIMAVETILASKDEFVKLASKNATEDWFKYNQEHPHKA